MRVWGSERGDESNSFWPQRAEGYYIITTTRCGRVSFLSIRESGRVRLLADLLELNNWRDWRIRTSRGENREERIFAAGALQDDVLCLAFTSR
jgi:hypothetical protein